jgi:sigma-B regulation protein RsbU (phosphoserine phosphatase)
MDTLLDEKVNGGLHYLYGATTKKEFCTRLESFLADLFRNSAFSVLTPADRDGLFYLEYSSGVDFHQFHKHVVFSEEMARVFQEGRDRDFKGDVGFTLQAGELTIPAHGVRVMRTAESVLGLLVFHAGPLGGVGEDSDLAQHIFDHVFAAFSQVCVCDHLQEEREQAEAKLQAIREIGELLGQLDLEILLSHVMAVYTRLTEAQVGSVVFERNLAGDVEWGLPRAALDKIRQRNGPTLASIVADTGEPILVRGYAQDPNFEPVEDFNIESFLCVPLISTARVLGVVSLVNSGPSKGGMFTEIDKRCVVTVSSLTATAIENAILHRDMIEKERFKANLQMARTIQRGMYPLEGLEIAGYDMAWWSQSCDETGGDYFDFLKLENDGAGFAIGDVAGHGIGAALLMATGRANLRALLSVKTDLKEVMERLNGLLFEDMEDETFMTMFIGCLNHREHTVEYVNAGHDQPLLYHRATNDVTTLTSTGIPLGMLRDSKYGTGDAQRLFPGDVMLLTTDGVWEATCAKDEHFGKERLQSLLATHAGETARGLVDRIRREVETFTGSVRYVDDFTLVVIKRVS